MLFASERFADAADEALLALAWREGRVLITEDNDFGALVFLRGLPHAGIVRLVGIDESELRSMGGRASRVEGRREIRHVLGR